MDFRIVVGTLFYCVIIEGRYFLRTGRGDDMNILASSSENDPSKMLGLIIFEHNEDSEETDESDTSDGEVWKGITKPIAKANIIDATDSSGDSNSDEYDDTDLEFTENDFKLYYEDVDYDSRHVISLTDLIREKTAVLRGKFKSCFKKAAKVCTEACRASYENACDVHSCKKKLKKTLKEECKYNCNDFFASS